MKLSLNQASREASKAKKTILEALRNGTLSGIKNGNKWEIDASELFRRFPKETGSKTVDKTLPHPSQSERDELITLREKVKNLELRLEETKEHLSDIKALIPAPKSSFFGRIFG